MKLFTLLPLAALGQQDCEAKWAEKVNSLLDETKSLLAVIETASSEGLNGNYVARITTAMNNARNNFAQCDKMDDLVDSVVRIQESDSTCDVNDLNAPLRDIREESFDQRAEIESLVTRYEAAMDGIAKVQLDLKNNVYVKDVFGKGRILITEVMNIFEAIKQNVEYDSTKLTAEAKKLREETELDLKDLEEKYKYISHDVDLLIYSIEPIIALLGIGEFNEVLCGTDIEIGCDPVLGGVLCSQCGTGRDNQGAVGLTNQADDVTDQSRQSVEHKIYEARKFLDSVPDDLCDRSQNAKENCESMFTRHIDNVNELVAYAERFEEVIQFLTKFDGLTTAEDILQLADKVLTYNPNDKFGEPHELDDWWKKAFSKFNFNPDERQNLTDDELSEYYKVARDAKILRHQTEDLLAQVKALIKTSEAIASGSAGVDSEEVEETKNQLRKLIKVVQEVVDDRRRDYNIDDEYDANYQNYLNNFDSMEQLIEQMQNNLNALNDIHTDYEDFKQQEGVDEFISEAAKFESLEKRSEQLAINVDQLKSEMSSSLDDTLNLENQLKLNAEEMQQRLDDIRRMTEKAKQVRKVIHQAHNIECKELYA